MGMLTRCRCCEVSRCPIIIIVIFANFKIWKSIMTSLDNWSKQQHLARTRYSCLLPAVYKLSSTLSTWLFTRRKANDWAQGALSSILTAFTSCVWAQLIKSHHRWYHCDYFSKAARQAGGALSSIASAGHYLSQAIIEIITPPKDSQLIWYHFSNYIIFKRYIEKKCKNNILILDRRWY